MVEQSNRYQTGDSENMNATKRVARNPKPVDASIALAMLQSAMSYCQSAKMPVVLEQQNTTLVINLTGVRAVQSTTGKVKFELITTLVNDGVTA